MERRRLISNQIRQIEEARLKHFAQAPNDGPHAMVRLLARVIGVGKRVSPFRQWSSSARHGPIGVAISNVPEGERIEHTRRVMGE
jgi:hypothetical protein